MRRHHALPALFLVIALLGISAAVLIEPPARFPTAIARATTTTAAQASPTTSSTLVAIEPSGLGALTSTLDAVWAQSQSPDSSCLVVQQRGRVLFERNPDVSVIPASAMKLLTAAAILDVLDPRERLRTQVFAQRLPETGVVEGDLWFVGGGDPVLGTADWAAHFERQPRLHTSMETLADRIVASGVREVRGGVIGSDTRYDAERYVGWWPQRYRDDNETGKLSALFVNDGFAVWDRQDELDVPWDDPPRDAAAVLTTLLRQRGVVVAREATSGPPPSGLVAEVGGIDSPAVADLVAAMISDSDNGTAELLVKELGLRRRESGSTAAGIEVVQESLAAQSVPLAGVVVRDGSGLDRGNRVTCRALVAVLDGAQPNGPLARGLPIAAQTGTLYKRFLATPVAGRLRAKTGSITGVAALAGFADAPVGELTFAHVLNGIGSYAAAQRVQDALGAVLVDVR